MSEPSVFTIRETTGPGRVVRLTDRGLPYRPYTLETLQRMATTWYPGNPVATATIFGAAEGPTQIDGAWKDKYIEPSNALRPILLDGEPPSDVREAVRFMDEITRAGQLLEVTWDETIRRGHLRRFAKRWLNRHDVEWSMGLLGMRTSSRPFSRPPRPSPRPRASCAGSSRTFGG